MEDLCPISHKFVWIQESKYHTLLNALQNFLSSMPTLVVVEDVEVAEHVTQLLAEYGILITVTKQLLSPSDMAKYQS